MFDSLKVKVLFTTW